MPGPEFVYVDHERSVVLEPLALKAKVLELVVSLPLYADAARLGCQQCDLSLAADRRESFAQVGGRSNLDLLGLQITGVINRRWWSHREQLLSRSFVVPTAQRNADDGKGASPWAFRAEGIPRLAAA